MRAKLSIFVMGALVASSSMVQGASAQVGGGNTFVVNENQLVVATLTSTLDGTTTPALAWLMGSTADSSKFAVSATGDVTFIANPNFEIATDGNTDNEYLVDVSEDNGASFERIRVFVSDVNEAPVITSNSGGATAAINYAENATTTVTTVTSTDVDGDARTYSFGGGADDTDFAINATTGVLTFVAAPDFEDDASRTVIVEATDDGTGTLTDTQTITVTITNVNEAPVITSNNSFTYAENATTAVATVAASDEDVADDVTFSISGGADLASFAINATTGVLTFLASPNREVQASYVVEVTATDDGTGTLTDTQTVTVTITGVNESNPQITSDGGGSTAAINYAENATSAVTTVTATDADNDGVTYSFGGGADDTDFAINATTGVLTFVAAPDFEDDASRTVIVEATDDGTGTLTDTQTITVTITDVNENPVITSNGGGSTAAINYAENATSTVATVVATDVDGDALTYSISASSGFEIDATTGALTFAVSPDFETQDSYVVTVTATDDGTGLLTDTQTITVTITNVNESVVITSNGGGSTAAVNYAENATSAVTTVVATDVDGDAVVYSITGGANDVDFLINATTGVLTFADAPDFENGTATRVVEVTATANGQTDTQTITVTILNDVPTNLVVTPSMGGFQFSVGATSEPFALIYSFEVRLTSTPNAEWISVGSATTRGAIGGLDNLSSYDIRVRAFDLLSLTFGDFVTTTATTLDAAGLNGSNGSNGSNGTDGTNGSNGTDGTNGAAGPAGATGATGPAGATGATGPAGATGATGAAGATGATGAAGVLVGFDGKVTTLSKAQVRILSLKAVGATSVRVNMYKKSNESFTTMQKRFLAVKKAIIKANPNAIVTAKYHSNTTKACASKSNRCAVVTFTA